MVVGRDNGLSAACPALHITFWPDKAALTKAVVAKAKADRSQRFFFHGQFNTGLWLALLSGGIKPSQFSWHIWGADLYEVSVAGNSVFSIRCVVWRARVGCVFATRGDLNYFAKQHPKVRGELLYFPTRMDPALNTTANDAVREGKLTIPWEIPAIAVTSMSRRCGRCISSLAIR